MKLKHSFEKQAAQGGTDYTKPPFRIRGKDLDDNFKQLVPKKWEGDGPHPYRIEGDENGWYLYPSVIFDVCENGEPRRYSFVARKES